MKIGDIVYLKSGSAPMTIVQMDGDPMTVTTRWFVNGGMQSVMGPEAALTETDPQALIDDKSEKARAAFVAAAEVAKG